MPRNKKPMGRPSTRTLPPRTDATPEEVAHAVLNAGRPRGPVQDRKYYCQDCKRQVVFPETFYNDNRCESCHKAVA